MFITGHTGFKGSWLTQWLKLDGANVTGFSLPPPTEPSLYAAANVGQGIQSIEGDVRDAGALAAALAAAKPEIVVHLAGQSLVRHSYDDPVATYGTNVMGTVNLLEAVRYAESVRVVLAVTSDKCYENGQDGRPFREGDPLGGRDPYSSSKACAEMVVAAYRSSFFSNSRGPRIASARAGNVIGGGDWAADRLVPDLVRAFRAGRPARIRHPDATRPWQFVLDALHGYRKLIETAFERDDLPQAWNFGPDDVRPVRWIADSMAARWGDSAAWLPEDGDPHHEASTLSLDSSRARDMLAWTTLVDSDTAIQWTTDWYKSWRETESAEGLTNTQIERFAERA